MKNWGLRILSAILTFTVGTGAAIIGWHYLKPVGLQPVSVAPNINLQLPPLPSPQIAEDTQPPDETDEDAQPPGDSYKPIKPHPVSISPYQIKRLIDESKRNRSDLDLESIWKKLKLKRKYATVAPFGGACKAGISTLELNSAPGNETLLKLDFGMPEMTVYLIFNNIGAQQSVKTGWNLLGYIPYTDGPPFVSLSERITSDGEHRWLVVDYGIGHGSGFGTGADDWYEVSERGVRKVLSYQNGYFINFQNPTIDRDNKVLKCEYRNGATTVVIQSSTSYGSYNTEIPESFSLWTNKRKAVFIKRQGMQKFVFDSQHSSLSAKELNPYYGYDADISNEDILKYNQRDLAKLAAAGNEKQKEWLRRFLHASNDIVAKQSLQKLLEGARP